MDDSDWLGKIFCFAAIFFTVLKQNLVKKYRRRIKKIAI